MVTYPRLLPVRHQLYSKPIEDVPAAVREAMRKAVPEGKIRKGQRIGITAGSRGTDKIGLVLKAAVEIVRERGGEPFVFPSMGSHGGATDEGQAKLLDEVFGINEKTMGCPILSSMKVVELGRTREHDIPVYVDEHVAKADGVLVVARVKAHTDFQGPYESGPMKMITIGMGKQTQAESVHAFGAWGLKHLIPEIGEAKIRLAKVLGSLAILEDGYDQVTEIRGLPAGKVAEEEPKLLRRAKRYQARLPFDELDLLVVDRMSKEISGTGMDTTVIGRRRIQGEPEWKRPRIEVLFVRDLDENASDNGIGMGLADLMTRRLYDKIDLKKTQVNGLTSGFAMRLMVPTIAADDREALEHAFYLLRRKLPEEVSMVRIRDTSHLERLYVSEALRPQVEADPRLEVVGPAEEVRFDREGKLVPDEAMKVASMRKRCGLPETETKQAA